MHELDVEVIAGPASWLVGGEFYFYDEYNSVWCGNNIYFWNDLRYGDFHVSTTWIN